MSQQAINSIRRILEIHHASMGKIRPHFILTGPSGSGKSFNITGLCDELGMQMIEVNCAQLTKEGLSGNSLSKALSGLENVGMDPCVIFLDEFDKLFISGNSNSDLAHESTNGIQNEMLKMLEAGTTQVYTGRYGVYADVSVDKHLFVFAGAFNGEADIDLDRLRQMGIKTEFLGRVGLTFNMEKVKLADLLAAVETNELLDMYIDLHKPADHDLLSKDVVAEHRAKFRADVVSKVQKCISDNYEHNTLGYRQITTLLHQYFINGTLETSTKKAPVFHKSLALPTPTDLFEG